MLLKTSEQKLGWALKLRKPSWSMWCRCMLVRLRSEDRLSPVPVKISEVTEESRKNQKTRSWFLFKYTCFGLWTFFWFVYISPTFNKNYLFFYSFKSWIMTLIPKKRGPECPSRGQAEGFRWFRKCPRENVFFPSWCLPWCSRRWSKSKTDKGRLPFPAKNGPKEKLKERCQPSCNLDDLEWLPMLYKH